MIYRAIGLMSGSSLDGLDIAYVELTENGGHWAYEIVHADCMAYTADWVAQLRNATSLNARDYQLLHTAYGHYIGGAVNGFIEKYGLQYKVAVVASHGHTTFHEPAKKMSAQLGDGAAIAAVTGLPVVSDLRAMDVALGGQGAPIVPIGERLLLKDADYFLNLGGIANISINQDRYLAFDVCAANRVLNMLAQDEGKAYDENGTMARNGSLIQPLLDALNGLPYYQQPAPKSLANDFGTDTVYPLIKSFDAPVADALHTYVMHIVAQVANVLKTTVAAETTKKLLVTGGGAFNGFLIECLQQQLQPLNIEVVIPEEKLVAYKEALIMALIGVLRWREENNVLASVTGAVRDSVGGALWMGQEA